MAKKTYTAKTPIEHNGVPYEPGDPLELDDKTEAPALLAVDGIEIESAKKSASK